jgi:hypothetical protein
MTSQVRSAEDYLHSQQVNSLCTAFKPSTEFMQLANKSTLLTGCTKLVCAGYGASDAKNGAASAFHLSSEIYVDLTIYT